MEITSRFKTDTSINHFYSYDVDSFAELELFILSKRNRKKFYYYDSYNNEDLINFSVLTNNRNYKNNGVNFTKNCGFVFIKDL